MLQPPDIDTTIRQLIRLAVSEDLGGLPGEPGAIDRTVAATIPSSLQCRGDILARLDGVICGLFLVPDILRHYDPALTLRTYNHDGEHIVRGRRVASITGAAGAILSAERVTLNFLGRLSGIATLTRRYVQKVENATPADRPKPVICDTRKTTPGWRALEKYAVRCGGGRNHRMGLYDGVMLKDNHLAALRARLGPGKTLANLTAHVRSTLAKNITLWLEVDSLEQLAEALPGGGADIILLDNMTPAQIRQAVALRNAQESTSRPRLEASGGITLANVVDVARTGVDRISSGALTHAAPSLDLALEVSPHD
jgi:nicotinate-nucleotide pyrophosphorylase (carboxylating)